eukprot:765610-Hanusia_phi.AAC.1
MRSTDTCTSSGMGSSSYPTPGRTITARPGHLTAGRQGHESGADVQGRRDQPRRYAGICARAALRRMLKSGQPQEYLCACTRRSDEERGVQTGNACFENPTPRATPGPTANCLYLCRWGLVLLFSWSSVSCLKKHHLHSRHKHVHEQT